jgi:hypothetical protein
MAEKNPFAQISMEIKRAGKMYLYTIGKNEPKNMIAP